MGWRTDWCGCGGGPGCSHGAATTLCVVPGEVLAFQMVSTAPVAGRLVRAEARTQAGGALVLDMTPYCTGDAADPMAVQVAVPPDVTAGVRSSGSWDGWVGSERVGFGPFLVELPISGSPGRVLTLLTWSPTLVYGEPFQQAVSIVGLLPEGEYPSGGDGVTAPEMLVYAPDGESLAYWKGKPQVQLDGERDAVLIDLAVEDVQLLGIGRFTYQMAVYNDVGERRIVLAGPLTVVEGG